MIQPSERRGIELSTSSLPTNVFHTSFSGKRFEELAALRLPDDGVLKFRTVIFAPKPSFIFSLTPISSSPLLLIISVSRCGRLRGSKSSSSSSSTSPDSPRSRCWLFYRFPSPLRPLYKCNTSNSRFPSVLLPRRPTLVSRSHCSEPDKRRIILTRSTSFTE